MTYNPKRNGYAEIIWGNGNRISNSSVMNEINKVHQDTINFDIYISGNGRHTVYLYTTDFRTVGVQSFYTAGDEVNYSEIVSVFNPEFTGINELAEGVQVIENRYYDLTGRELPAAPSTGIYLQRTTYSNGSCSTNKVVK